MFELNLKYTLILFQWLCVLSGGFGLFIAANYSLTSIILVELITLERFTNAYGLLLLVQGVANLIGPPLAGWLYDLTGSYNLSFYLAGAMIIVSSKYLNSFFFLKILNFYKNKFTGFWFTFAHPSKYFKIQKISTEKSRGGVQSKWC